MSTNKSAAAPQPGTTSPAVQQTMAMFPPTHVMGFHLDDAKQTTDPRKRPPRTAPKATSAGVLAAMASNTVQGPASIVELARALNVGAAGEGPQLMYEWVYNNIEWEPGWGLNKGAVGTILDGMGNSFDQANLLAALLRQAGYTANIVMGSIRLLEADYQAWWNVTDIWGAQAYCLNEYIPIVTAPTWNGTTYYMDIKHVWVEWVSTSTYIFDPSKKAYTRKTGLSSSSLGSALGYNATTFMSNAQSGSTVTTDYAQNINRSNIRSDLQTMTANLVTYIKNNAVGSAPAGTATVDDVIGGQEIVPATIPLLQTSLPYQKPSDTPTTWTGDVPSTFKPTLQVQFPNWNTPGVWDIDQTFESEDLAGKRLTLWYDGSLVPSLYLDGTSVDTGLAQGAGTWTSIFLTVQHPAYDASNYPLSFQQFYQTNWQWWQSSIYAGKYYLIGSAWGNLGDGPTTYHQKRTKTNEAAGGAATSESVLGERLATTFFSWAAQNSKVADLVNRLKNCHTMYNHQIGVISFDSGGSGAVAGDLGGVSGSSTNFANDTTQTPINDTVLAMHGVALEAAVPAQVTGLTPGISTTSVIDKAVQSGNKIYKGTSANWRTGSNVESTLVTNGFNSTDMSNLYDWYIQFGDSVLIHDQPTQTLGSWQGWGYFAYPTAGAYGIINGGIKGGGGQPGDITIDNWGRRLGPDGQPISWDPIGMASGDFYYQTNDLQIGSGDYPFSLPFPRYYSSAKQFTDGSLGRGWNHGYDLSARVGSDGMLALGRESAIQASASITQLYVSVDLVSDTARPVAKLVTMTLGDNWWIDQLVNNTVLVTFPDSAHTFIKQPDGTYTAPLNGPSVLTLAGGLYTLKTPDQTAYNFDSSGNISTIVFPYGMTITCTYTGGKLTSVTNGLTRTLTLSYTGNYLSSVSDGTSRSVVFSVNGTTKNLDSATDPDSKATTFVYDNPGRLTQIKKPANPTVAVVSNTYDSLDRVKEQRDALNNLWQYFLAGSRAEEVDPQSNRKIQYFNPLGMVIREIDKAGKVSKFEFDGLNRQIKYIAPEGNSVQQTYDLKGNVLTRTWVAKSGSGLANLVNSWTYHSTFNKPITHTDARSNQTTFSYDATTGNLLTIQRPVIGGSTPTVTFTWNSRGQMLTRTDETGIITQFNYDASTEKLTSVVADQGAGRLNLTSSFGYTSRGDVNSVTDPRGKITTFAFDVKRRMTQRTDPSPFSFVSNFYYDANDNRNKVERQTGNPSDPWQTSTATFDSADQLLTSVDPFNRVVTRIYDNMRRLWKVTDQESRVTEFAYDALSRISTVKDPSLTIAETRLYTDNGLVASVKDARNNLTSLSYDGHDRLDKRTFADTSYEQNQSYDANGNVLTYRTRSGNTIVNTFDVLNRVATSAPQGQGTVTFTYDLAGRLTKAGKPVVSGDPSTGDFQRFFDTAGRFYKEQYPDGKVVQHTLDANGNATKTTWPDSYFIDRTFDELNRLTDIKLNGSGSSAVQLSYNQLSQRTQMTFGNGSSIVYQPQLNNDMTGITHNFVGGSIDFAYGFNNAHELVTASSSDTAAIWHPGGASSITYGTADNVNKYPTVGGISYSYDGNSNLSGDGTWTWSFDTENHLLSATKTGVSASFVYDPFHRQAQKTVGSAKSRYIYSGWQRIADYDGATDTLQNRYVYGTGLDEPLITVSSAGVLTYLHQDRLGSIVATSNSSGVVTNKNLLGAFGEVGSIAGTTFGFAAQRYDSELGLHYCKHRVYSQTLGRFLQPDPIGYGDGLNLYAYVSNNPLNLTDPLGLWGDWGPYAAGPGANGGWSSGSSGYANGYGPLGPPGWTYTFPVPTRPDGGRVGGRNNFGYSYGSNTSGQFVPGWGTPNPDTAITSGSASSDGYGVLDEKPTQNHNLTNPFNVPNVQDWWWGDDNNPHFIVRNARGDYYHMWFDMDSANEDGTKFEVHWIDPYTGSEVIRFPPGSFPPIPGGDGATPPHWFDPPGTPPTKPPTSVA